MKRYFLFSCLLVIVFASCKKPPTFDPAKQAAIDDANIRAYIANHNIVGAKDTLGLYYEILAPGLGQHPTVNSNIQVIYTGKLLDGTLFAPVSSIASGYLNGFIAGWQLGIPKIAAGGEIILLVPSALAYGQGSPGYPIVSNSVLIFDVQLNSFQ